MSHYSEAERMVESPMFDSYGRPADAIPALTHAILALIERLEDPILTIGIDMGEE